MHNIITANHHKILCAIPAGHGKSRVVPALVYLLHQQESLKRPTKYLVLFSDDVLMQNDRGVLNRLAN